MSWTTIVLIVVGVMVLIGVIAWAIQKAGFKVTKGTVKTPVVELEMERLTEVAEASEGSASSTSGTKAEQIAEQGGTLSQSRIEAPADAGAEARQQSSGKGSRVEDSTIKLD